MLKPFFPSVFAQVQEEKSIEKIENESVVSEANDELKSLIEDDIRKHLSTETGMDRLRAVFLREKSDILSPQLIFASETALNTGIITFIGTYFFGARMAASKFIEKHTHKTFATKFSALRTYNDAMVFGGLRFGMRMGAKAGVFTWIFMFSSQLLSTYRNKSSLTDYVIAGGLTCGLLKMNLGLRGFVAGSTIGTFLGLVGGAALLGLTRLQGSTAEEVHHRELYEKFAVRRQFSAMQKETDEIVDVSLTNTETNTQVL